MAANGCRRLVLRNQHFFFGKCMQNTNPAIEVIGALQAATAISLHRE